MPLLTVSNLRTSFRSRHGLVRAVDGVSFTLERGEALGIVGESGSGKSVACTSILGLIPQPPGVIEGGSANFDGVDLLQATPAQLRSLRGRRIAMVFQDPMTSLNPYLRISEQLIEPLLIHGSADRKTALRRAITALQEVGVPDAARRVHAWPHEFSGGMRQRVMIAMALITGPDLLIADEPTTALDVTVQAQILDVLRRLRQERGMAVILISHDLGVIAGLCDRMLVMYAGRVVESGTTSAVFAHPQHPYTRALRQSIPALQPPGVALPTIPGAPPDPARRDTGCAFAPRCAYVRPSCLTRDPALAAVAPGHASACLRVQEGDLTW